jgi:hypothetical protein
MTGIRRVSGFAMVGISRLEWDESEMTGNTAGNLAEAVTRSGDRIPPPDP